MQKFDPPNVDVAALNQEQKDQEMRKATREDCESHERWLAFATIAEINAWEEKWLPPPRQTGGAAAELRIAVFNDNSEYGAQVERLKTEFRRRNPNGDWSAETTTAEQLRDAYLAIAHEPTFWAGKPELVALAWTLSAKLCWYEKGKERVAGYARQFAPRLPNLEPWPVVLKEYKLRFYKIHYEALVPKNDPRVPTLKEDGVYALETLVAGNAAAAAAKVAQKPQQQELLRLETRAQKRLQEFRVADAARLANEGSTELEFKAAEAGQAYESAADEYQQALMAAGAA